jgi:hypothetical protein
VTIISNIFSVLTRPHLDRECYRDKFRRWSGGQMHSLCIKSWRKWLAIFLQSLRLRLESKENSSYLERFSQSNAIDLVQRQSVFNRKGHYFINAIIFRFRIQILSLPPEASYNNYHYQKELICDSAYEALE